jgi:hypothetical protein
MVGVGLVRCGEALVGVYVDYRVEYDNGFHSVAIIDLISSICFTVDVESFQCVHHYSF